MIITLEKIQGIVKDLEDRIKTNENIRKDMIERGLSPNSIEGMDNKIHDLRIKLSGVFLCVQ